LLSLLDFLSSEWFHSLGKRARDESDMTRNLSGWGVTGAGLALAAGGVYAMSTGWDMILLERGWSLFIAGSVALSGGVVTMALGRVVAHLARLTPKIDGVEIKVDSFEIKSEAVAVAPKPAATAPAPSPFKIPSPAPPPPPDANPVSAKPARPAVLTPPSFEEPTEVDRYSAGEATYVMMSDGSVEVRGPEGSQRYPSLAALRAEAEARQR
jgi:hypothetical protein